jgi:fatty-acyl-CoA synthase
MEERGFAMTHVYGLTETYGPAVICSSKPESGSLSPGEQAKIKARQGVSYHSLEDVQILDAQSVHSVAYDTTRLGEAMFPVYPHKGLSKESQSDGRSFCLGWFHSGDLGVRHPNQYIQLKDRSKDIIICGGENTSSIEIEDVLYRHPGVPEPAVVAKADDRSGETPCAFVHL